MSGRYRLANGREVFLGRFEVEATYSGLIEGSLEQGSRLILRGLAEAAAKSLASDNPLVVVKPRRNPTATVPPERTAILNDRGKDQPPGLQISAFCFLVCGQFTDHLRQDGHLTIFVAANA